MIQNFKELTYNPKFFMKKYTEYTGFDYYNSGKNEYQFNLFYHCGFGYMVSYHPAPFKGTIKPTRNGCRIEAHKQKSNTVISSIISLIFIIAVYFVAVAALFVELDGAVIFNIIASIVTGFMATGMLIFFLYTHKKWKDDDFLLEIIDEAANAERQRL